MKKQHLPVLLSLLLLPVLTAATLAQSADDVVEKYLAAIGGRAALGKITSRKSTGTITLETPNGALSGPVEIYLKAPNKSRAVMKLDLTAVGAAGEMIVEQIFDGTAGYALNSMQGDTELGSRQVENMRNTLFPTPLLTYKEKGSKLELLPKDLVNGRDAIVMRATPKTGPATTVFFDAETYLILRTVVVLDGDLTQTSQPSDYRASDGVKVPFLIVNSNDVQTLTIRLTKVEHNIAIDDAVFVKK